MTGGTVSAAILDVGCFVSLLIPSPTSAGAEVTKLMMPSQFRTSVVPLRSSLVAVPILRAPFRSGAGAPHPFPLLRALVVHVLLALLSAVPCRPLRLAAVLRPIASSVFSLFASPMRRSSMSHVPLGPMTCAIAIGASARD